MDVLFVFVFSFRVRPRILYIIWFLIYIFFAISHNETQFTNMYLGQENYFYFISWAIVLCMHRIVKSRDTTSCVCHCYMYGYCHDNTCSPVSQVCKIRNEPLPIIIAPIEIR